jgi:hypothetical protein
LNCFAKSIVATDGVAEKHFISSPDQSLFDQHFHVKVYFLSRFQLRIQVPSLQ